MEGNLSFFPAPYPDEDFRSIIYRYHKRSLNLKFSDTKMQLFKVRSEMNSHFQHNLDFMINQLPKGTSISIEMILSDNTFLNVFKPFLNTNKFSELKQGLKKERKDSTIDKLFISQNNRFISSEIKYCLLCIREDDKNYGEVYVHRLHQLHNIDICHVHLVPLITACPVCNNSFANRNNYDLLSQPRCSCGYDLIGSLQIQTIDQIDLQIRLINDIKYLLMLKRQINRGELLERFYILLGLNGYLHISGEINKKLFMSKFIEHYKPETFKIFKIPKGYLYSKDLILKLFKMEKKNQNIVFLLLIMMFLAGSVKRFLEGDYALSYKIPFGNGPWCCRNKLCRDYKKGGILRTIRRNDTGKYISGYFQCPKCLMIYKKKWMFNEEKEKSTIQIISMGLKWEKELIDMYNDGKSFYSMSQTLKNTKFIIKRFLKEMLGEEKFTKREKVYIGDITFSYFKNIEKNKLFYEHIVTPKDFLSEACTTIDNNIVSEYRKEILNCIQLDIDKILTRTDVKKCVGQKVYGMLLKYDREWMEKILPPKKSLNWEKIDKVLSEELEVVAISLYQRGITKRIKKYTIISKVSKISQYRLQLSHSKLPLSTGVLKKYIEKKDRFQIRILEHKLDRLKKHKYREPYNFQLLQRVFPAVYGECLTDTKKEIEQRLKELRY